jgi:RNA polymerase sigma-70 factor (ECF subfamily)
VGSYEYLTVVTDDAIVVRAVQPFEAFYRANYRLVLACVYALAGPALAEDLTQEAFLVASQRWDEVGGLENPGAWVRRVAINHAASAYRRRRAEARALRRFAGGDHEAIPTMSEHSEEVWRAVRSLPRRQREAIVLCLVAGYSRMEAAELMNVGIETIKTHLERGRQALAMLLKESTI